MEATRVVISDLQGVSKDNSHDTLEYRQNREKVRLSQTLSKAIPRDRLVWSKSESEKFQVAKAKRLWKSYMRLMYPGVTNKAGFYTQKAKIWS